MLLAGVEPDGHFDPRRYEADIRLLHGDLQEVLGLESELHGSKYGGLSTRTSAETRIRGEAGGRGRRSRGSTPRRPIPRGRATRAGLPAPTRHAERHLGNRAQAREYLTDLADPAARGQYRYIEAKAAVVLAELERDEGNHQAAIDAATNAYRLAWCDGPPYTYYWTLERARELLHELDAAVPDLE